GGTGAAMMPPGCGDGVHQPGELCLEQSTPLASGFRASRLAVARLDADVRFDLVARDSAGSIRAFLGKADGSMQTKAPIDRGVDGDRTDIVLGDLDGDGNQDIVLVEADVRIEAGGGDGAGSFTEFGDTTPED